MRLSKIQVISTFLGNLFEHYDTALFSILSPFIAPLFFPNYDPISALILTYSIIPLGMISRPVGSLLFGYFGDRYGYKKALIFSLFGMGIISGLIALLPTHENIGVIAPLLLLLGRILQNIFGVGETIGGAVFLISESEERHKDLMSGIYNASTVGGILLASMAVSILGTMNFIDQGWRYLYLFGCITAFFGCILRTQLSSKDVRTEMTQRTPHNFIKLFWRMKNQIGIIAVVSGFSYASYSIAFVVINGFIPMISQVSQTETIHLNTLLLIVDFLALPLFGLSTKFLRREQLMAVSALSAAILGIPLFLLLQDASLFTILFVRFCFVLIGVSFSATFYSWAQNLVPKEHCYALIAFAYAIGSQVFGAPTSAISLWMFQKTGIISSVGWYWALLGVLSSALIVYTTTTELIFKRKDAKVEGIGQIG